MDKSVYELRSEYWRQIIRECNARKPGVTKLAWFKEHNINSKTYYYWQKRFRTEAVVSLQTENDISVPANTMATAPAFVDITSSVSSINKTDSISADHTQQLSVTMVPELMIQLSDYRVFVNSSIQEKTLETVLKVLHHA